MQIPEGLLGLTYFGSPGDTSFWPCSSEVFEHPSFVIFVMGATWTAGPRRKRRPTGIGWLMLNRPPRLVGLSLSGFQQMHFIFVCDT